MSSILTIIYLCTGFSCGRINFLQSSSYGVMFLICDYNSVGNTGIF